VLVISRPTTDQLIAEACQDLLDAVLPALTDETLQVRVAMAETVLRNAAVRAAHEIAWMSAETVALSGYARAVEARVSSVELSAALAALDEAPRDSLHLADVVEAYERASQAIAAALAAAQREGFAELLDAARDLLNERVGTEKVVMATYAVVGR
jgi:hypothetical protein